MTRGFALLIVAFGALSAASGARAQADAGPCLLDGGTIDQQGKCDGQDAVFCSSTNTATGHLVSLHCPAFAINATVTLNGGFCEVLSGIGAWCTFPTRTPCAFVDPQGSPLYFGCGTPSEDDVNFLCDINDGCTDISQSSSFGTCLLPTPKCLAGSFLRTDCTSWNQAITFDCASQAGVCVDNGGGDAKCVNGAGGECDNTLLTCATGLTCQAGRCKDPNAPPDAGTTTADAGTVAADAGHTGADAGNTGADAGNTGADAGTRDAGTAGEGEGEGEGEGDTDPGIPLGPGPAQQNPVEKPLETGCGCSVDGDAYGNAGALAFGAALALCARRLTRRR